MPKDLTRLQKKIQYEFKDFSLLSRALTHRSYSKKNYERLEFLGDALLNCIIGEALFRRFPDAKEGELSRYRALLVKEKTLAELAQALSVGDYLQLSSGELKAGGHHRASILSDAMEAIIGAMYLDSNHDFACCQRLVLAWYEARFEQLPSAAALKDPKTRLQEYLQSRKLSLPVYEIERTEGAAHDQVFYVRCQVDTLPYVSKSHAKTRRDAEQLAAEKYLTLLKVE